MNDETEVEHLILQVIDISKEITAAKNRITTLGEDRRYVLRALVKGWRLTQREIAARTGLTQPHISQILGPNKPYRQAAKNG